MKRESMQNEESAVGIVEPKTNGTTRRHDIGKYKKMWPNLIKTNLNI